MAIEIVQVTAWDHLTWLRHGFSTRAGGHSAVYGGGQLNLGFTADDRREDVLANRADFLDAVDGTDALATVRQVHGRAVLRVTAAGAAGDADGLATDRQGLMLGVLTADCVPVLLVDTQLRAVAAVHAGWRGTATGIVGAAVQAMQDQFGSEPEDLLATVGPSIGPCCYQVGEELREHFAPELFTGDHLNLVGSEQAATAGGRAGSGPDLGACRMHKLRA